VARPTKYKAELTIQECEKYLDFSLFQTYTKEVVVKDQIQVINAQRPNSIPSIAGLATHLDVMRNTIYDWAKLYPEFSNILDRLQRKQEEFLLFHGLTKGYDSSFAKFITQNVTRFRDKLETSNTNREISINIDSDDANL
tara:strand:- start:1970 stop:2389 length:420 start_codon:yes stop_codon:yes gene_type:complete